MRLLFVDDDRINILLFEHVCLQTGGIELRCAESGAQALEIASEWQPHLLVIDLHLPDTNGLDLLPRLRETIRWPRVPAVLCTAELTSDVEPSARAAGFDDCWCKPIQLLDMGNSLRAFALVLEPGTPS